MIKFIYVFQFLVPLLWFALLIDWLITFYRWFLLLSLLVGDIATVLWVLWVDFHKTNQRWSLLPAS